MIKKPDVTTSSGLTSWTTDLFMPTYVEGEIGDWKIDRGGQLVHDWGYHTGPCLVEMLPSLARKVKSKQNADSDCWETWMSLTPHEIESQELGRPASSLLKKASCGTIRRYSGADRDKVTKDQSAPTIIVLLLMRADWPQKPGRRSRKLACTLRFLGHFFLVSHSPETFSTGCYTRLTTTENTT